MLLRKVNEHFIAQNWSAVTFDVIIVVIGVFIGIQVSNWNEGRLTSERGEELTERLIADLRHEAWNLASTEQYMQEVLDSAERLRGALVGQSELANTDLIIQAYRASQYIWLSKARATYDELTSTGEIGLVTDSELRRIAIIHYNSRVFDDLVVRGLQSLYRQIFRQIVPTAVHRELHVSCGDRGVFIDERQELEFSLNYNCVPDLSAEQIDATAATIRSNEALLPALRWRIADIESDLAEIRWLDESRGMQQFLRGGRPE
jgi:hypothetical protein